MTQQSLELEIVEAAYYRSLGMTQEEIAGALRKSVATVTRRLAEAHARGYLREVTALNVPDQLLAAVVERVSDKTRAKAFEEYFGRRILRKAIIVPVLGAQAGRDAAGGHAAAAERRAKARAYVGRAAAGHLASVIAGGHVVGVSYGRTLRTVSEAALALVGTGKNRVKVDFFPLVGGLLALIDPRASRPEDRRDAFRYSAAEIALQLAHAFRGESSGQLQLPTPAFCPRQYLEDGGTLAGAMAFVRSIPEYRAIFGVGDHRHRDPDSRISQMNVAITSVGGPPARVGDQRETGWYSKEDVVFDSKEIDALIEAGAVGDFCGHFITEGQMEGSGSASVLDELNQRLIGPHPMDFQRCAEKAHLENTPGVILVAHSADKAAATLSALKNGCVSTLIVDDALARKMEELEPSLT